MPETRNDDSDAPASWPPPPSAISQGQASSGGSASDALRLASKFIRQRVEDAADTFKERVEGAAETLRERVEGAADTVGGVATGAADTATGVVSVADDTVTDVASNAADTAVEATGCLVRLAKRILFVLLLPLWLILMLFGIGPLG